MKDKLLCPNCKKPLHCGAQLDSDGNIIELYQCANPECESTEFLVGCREFWDILVQYITTRKALDKAIWWLNEIVENHRFTPISTAEKALAEINQKEVK